MSENNPQAPTQPLANGVNLLQLQALKWLYAQAQLKITSAANIPGAAHSSGQVPPTNAAQSNLNNWFSANHGAVGVQQQQQQSLYNNLSQWGATDGIKQIYNHAQSASQNNLPFNFGKSPNNMPFNFGQSQPLQNNFAFNLGQLPSQPPQTSFPFNLGQPQPEPYRNTNTPYNIWQSQPQPQSQLMPQPKSQLMPQPKSQSQIVPQSQSQSQSQLVPQQQQQNFMGFVPQQQPFSGYQDQSAPYYPYGQAPYYGYMGNGPNMAYMPPGQQQQGFYPGMSDYNHMNPPYDQAYWDQQANANSIPYGGHPMQPRHVYVNGALYNADLVEPPVDFGRPPPEFGPNNSLLETEDDSYDPMDPVMPTIYGIRFYNPNNGPDGAIPPRAPKKRKCSHNMYMNSWQPSKAANYFGQGMPWYNNAYPPVPYNNLPTGGNFPNYTYDNSNGTANNNRSQLAPEMPMGSSAGTNAGGSATTSATGQNFIPILSPSSKTKRRQGRSRPRGYIQSFGIVAPLSHNNNGTKNSAGDAKANVPAAAEKKSPAKKVENSDANDLTLKWPLPAEGNKPDQKS